MSDNSRFKIAVGKVDVTPNKPIKLIGFGQRTGLSEGVYQPLFVKVMVLADEQQKVVLICGDLLNFGNDGNGIKLMRKILMDECGLQADQLIFNVSHTHCGPDTSDPEYAAELIAKTTGLVKTCLSQTRDARLYFGRGKADIGVNRRGKNKDGAITWRINPYGPVDHEVTVIKAVDDADRIVAVISNYACHPTTIGGYLIGGDYAGYNNQMLETQLPGAVAFFVQGAGGDIKPYHASAKDPYKFEYEGGPERPRIFGRKLADAVLDVLASPMAEITGPIHATLGTVEMPLMNNPLMDEDESLFKGRKRRGARLAALMLASMNEKGEYKQTNPFEIFLLRIGSDFTFIGLCGEPCVRIGLRIKAQMIPGLVLLAGYTGSTASFNYIPSMDMIPEKGYETSSYPYSPEAEDYLVAEVMNILAVLKNNKEKAVS